MPPHPIDASYNHVIKSSATIIEWYVKEGIENSKDVILLESWHLLEVSKLLNDYLLYGKDLSEKYWQEIRIEYVSKAEVLPKLCHHIGWEFLGNATIGAELVDQIRDEENKIRKEFPEIVEEYQKGLSRFHYKHL